LHLSGYSINGQAYSAVIFEQSSGPPRIAKLGLTSDQYQQTFNQLTAPAQSYRLVDVSGYDINGQAHYAAIFEQSSGPAWVSFHGLTSDQYQQTFTQWTGQGYRLLHLSGYSINGQAQYAVIFEQSTGLPRIAKLGLTSDQYQQTFNQLTGQGYQLVDVSGYQVIPL